MDVRLRELERASAEDQAALAELRDVHRRLGDLAPYHETCARLGILPLELREDPWPWVFQVAAGDASRTQGSVECAVHGRSRPGPFSLSDVGEVYAIVDRRRETLSDRVLGCGVRLKDGRFASIDMTLRDTGGWATTACFFPCLRKLVETGFPMNEAGRSFPAEVGCGRIHRFFP